MTLENKLGIIDDVALVREEERISKRASLSLYQDGSLTALEPGSFSTLAAIHGRLFGELYPFAGRLRTVNLEKGGFRFAPARYLPETVRTVERMPQTSFNEIAEKYVEMNVAHPFREGNGRAGRIWLDHMLRAKLGKTVDWSAIACDDYLLAMWQSPVNDTRIKSLIEGALSEDLENASLLVRSIDASFAYEGLAAFRADEL